MQRRTFLATSAGFVLAAPHIAAASTQRRFTIWRDGSNIGEHTMSAVQRGGNFEIAIDIKIAVKVLAITAYRYELSNREVWSGGKLQSVKSRVNDDGDKEFANVAAAGGGLQIEGSGYSGKASGDAVTTSYFATPFLKRGPWISTQSGKPLNVRVAPVGGRGGWHQVSGELTTRLGYNGAGEWVGCEFDAGGELATYELKGGVGRIAALWADA